MFGLKIIGAGHSSNYSGTSLGRSRILKDGNFDGLRVTAGSVEIEGIHVDGETGNGGDGISIEETRCLLRDITISNQGNAGLRIGKSSGNTNLWRLYNVLCLNNSNHGIFIHDDGAGLPNANTGVAVGLDLRDNDVEGLRLDNCIDNQFFGLHAAGNGGYGIRITGNSEGHNFFFPYLENNTSSNGIMENGSRDNLVFGVRRGADDDWTDNGVDNFILGRNRSHNFMFHGKGNISFKDLHITHEVVSGLWKLHQDSSTRSLQLDLVGTNGNGDVEIVTSGTGTANLNIKDGGLKVGDGALIKKYLSATKSYNMPSLADGSAIATTVTVTGAAVGDLALASLTSVTTENVQITAHVQSANTVRVVFQNVSGDQINPASGILRVGVFQH